MEDDGLAGVVTEGIVGAVSAWCLGDGRRYVVRKQSNHHGPQSRMVFRRGEGFACRPCYDGRDFLLCTSNGCMQQISVEMVMAQVDGVLAAGAGPSRLVFPSAAGGIG